jgi:hypothetical protein
MRFWDIKTGKMIFLLIAQLSIWVIKLQKKHFVVSLVLPQFQRRVWQD